MVTPADPVVRLALGRLLAELLWGVAVGRALGGGRWAAALVITAGLLGLSAGRGVSRSKKRRPQRAAHLIVIGAALAACSLRLEGGVPTGGTLAPATLLVGAALWDLARERAERLKEPLRPSPMSALAVLGGAAAGGVLGATSVARVTALALALAIAAAMTTLSATFRGAPGRPTAKPFDAAVLVTAGALGLIALGLG
jgi:hypothetical protein